MADTAQPTAVALDEATVAFRVAGDRVYTAVERASLSVAHGEFVAIVGPTGCGKSTLLNVAAGLLKPAAGSIKIFDQPPTGWYTDATQAGHSFYWEAFSEHLRRKGWPEESINDLDESTFAVMERLADPKSREAVPKKGLVVGYVQSGKTAHFTGVIAKAIDAGYRLVIVLTGTIDLLRQQTQRRIAAERLKNLLTHFCSDEHAHFLALADHLAAHATASFEERRRPRASCDGVDPSSG